LHGWKYKKAPLGGLIFFKKVNYLINAFDNVKFILKDNILYITAQKVATCVFKSFLMSVFYYVINTNPELNFDLYYKFSEACFEWIKTYSNMKL
jgi:hypothetical protein